MVFHRTQSADGVTYARVAQVLADLMTGPGRGPAEVLTERMRDKEVAWRHTLKLNRFSQTPGRLCWSQSMRWGAHGEAVILVGDRARYAHTEAESTDFSVSPYTYTILI